MSDYNDNLKGYNGWTNHPTWLVNLWLDGDCLDGMSASEIKEFVEELIDEQLGNHCGARQPNGLAFDLIQSALDDVNWRELAEHHQIEAPDAADEV